MNRIAVIVVALLCISCSPRIIEHVVYQRDTTYITKIDSIYKYERDSVFVKEKGDTVYKYVEKVRYRDRWRVDTLVKVKVDSVTVERVEEVEVEKPLSWWKRAEIGAFPWLVAALLLLLLWTFRKQILKIIKI